MVAQFALSIRNSEQASRNLQGSLCYWYFICTHMSKCMFVIYEVTRFGFKETTHTESSLQVKIKNVIYSR